MDRNKLKYCDHVNVNVPNIPNEFSSTTDRMNELKYPMGFITSPFECQTKSQ